MAMAAMTPRLAARCLTRLSSASCKATASVSPLRTFTASTRRLNADPPKSIKDPSHPYLHYHPFPSPPPGQMALSFLASKPVPGSKTILGYLPLGEGTLEDFREEPKFMQVLHDSIQSGLKAGIAESVEFEASTRPSDGYIHITDERALPPAGRIGEPEDIIASVFVQDGQIQPETYAPTPTYRIVTGDGPMMLPKGLGDHLVRDLEQIDRQEKGK